MSDDKSKKADGEKAKLNKLRTKNKQLQQKLCYKEKFQAILKQRFGFQRFRPGQLEALCALMENDRLLCIQPTGYGKSLLYQIPAVLLDGITLVISPLLALMRDQMMQLHQRFNITSASINSDQTEEENGEARKLAIDNKVKILFVSPEQLDNLDQFEFLIQLTVSLIVIDEAHCISTWGHDFRPSYRQIIQLVRAVEKKDESVRILGLTATANHKTADDIKFQLGKLNHAIYEHRESMDRPNIQLSAFQASGIAEKLSIVGQIVKKLSGDGLIYCATRENTELVAEWLRRCDVNAVAYHAGFHSDEKRRLQYEFTHGKYKVIAATNALGMGIDKSDLRFIIHFDVPGSITAYYQEVGRCGRDGLPAQGALLFDHKDKKIQEHFIKSAQPTPGDFKKILQIVSDADESLKLVEIKRLAGMHPTLVTVIVAELVEQEYLIKSKQSGSQVYRLNLKNAEPNLDRYKNQYQIKTAELFAMLQYGEQLNQCRMQILRRALGDLNAVPCGHCDVCADPSIVIVQDKILLQQIDTWLAEKTVTISPTKKKGVASGVAIFDAKLRSPLFVHFMRHRASDINITADLQLLIKKQLETLLNKHQFTCVIPVPSKTWIARDLFATFIAEQLNVPVFLDYLSWREMPEKRQGELLNNDQRRFNVLNKMRAGDQNVLLGGTILLLDDYTGSGATIQEATRVLQKDMKFKGEIVPFAIASIKWRLGSVGMI